MTLRLIRVHAIACAVTVLGLVASDATAQRGADTTGRGRGVAADTTGGRRGGGGGGQRGGGGGGRGGGAVRGMTLTVPWANGGPIPIKYTQAGEEFSPALSWSGAPDSTKSFVLLVTDITNANVGGTDGFLQWLVWNIPGKAAGLPEHVPQGPTQPDGTQQVGNSGPYYRGPGAPSTAPPHTYMFELMALDAMIDVPSVNVWPNAQVARTAVIAAIAGHVRGKAYALGTFAYPKP